MVWAGIGIMAVSSGCDNNSVPMSAGLSELPGFGRQIWAPQGFTLLSSLYVQRGMPMSQFKAGTHLMVFRGTYFHHGLIVGR
ncbi:MAG: hypothetical protein CMI09_01480 [Oceanospirillaceae bacterium]|nr:hypothetical protein [Oceanospirillaceae bacterium]